MPLFKTKSTKFGKKYSYKLLPLSDFITSCIKITELDSNKISFLDNTGRMRFIIAEYIPFWGRDIYAEVLYDLYGGSGLTINDPRSKDYFDEAKGYLNDRDFIEFCNLHKARWQKQICLDSNKSGFT